MRRHTRSYQGIDDTAVAIEALPQIGIAIAPCTHRPPKFHYKTAIRLQKAEHRTVIAMTGIMEITSGKLLVEDLVNGAWSVTNCD